MEKRMDLVCVIGTETTGRAAAQAIIAGFPARRTGFESGSGHVGFVVEIMVLGQVFSDWFPLPIFIPPITP
jgi:hypothetical protein